MIPNQYMEQLITSIIKTRGVTHSTAFKYVQNLYVLNGKKVFENLRFLNNVEEHRKYLEKYQPPTKVAFAASVVSVLSLSNQDTQTYKKWTDLMNEYKKKLQEERPANTKTEKQEKNWMEWDEIRQKRDEIGEKAVSEGYYDDIMSYLVLSLYTDFYPRRNMDYIQMVIVPQWNAQMPEDVNYLSLRDSKFIFNVYKTASSKGQLITNFGMSKKLKEAIRLYIKERNLSKDNWFLVDVNGKHYTTSAQMTRLLNKALGKKVGASMIRHIYLSNKYGKVKEQMEHDAELMGHSVEQQQNYIVDK